MILTVTLNPSVDLAMFIDQLHLGDTNRVQRVERDAGGKGVNVSRVIAELGAQTTATGFLGGPTGGLVRNVLNLQGVKHDFVEINGETRTNFSIETADGTPPTTFNDRGPSVTTGEFESLVLRVTSLLPICSWVTLGGSLPPGVPVDAFEKLGKLVVNAGVKLMLDADGEAQVHGLKARPHFIKPNIKEASRLLGRPLSTLEESVSAAQELFSGLDRPDGIVVLSRGADGAVLVTGAGTWVGESPKVAAKSSIGSGDSMIAGILWGLRTGLSMDDAFRYGLAAGAATATTDGSEIARLPVIQRLLPSAAVYRA